jgi:hypothetical protein
MEVHAHAHTPRKKFTHYLWEFIMLFLAVFCGFLAENFREHQVEKNRGRQYIIAFYEDLKTDSAAFSKIIKSNEIKLAAFADIFTCYDTIRKNWRSTSCLIPLVKNSRSNSTVTFSDGTLQQLKNAGGYRMLNDEDRDSIMRYDNSIQDYRNYQSTFFQESQDIVRSSFSMISDFESNKFLYPRFAGADSSHTEMPLIFSDDKVLLNKYFNDLFRYESVINGQNFQIKSRLQKAERLIDYFNKKYHLK